MSGSPKRIDDIASARSAHGVVPDDANDLPWVTRALYVGGEGNVHARLVDGTEVTFRSMKAGAVYAFEFIRIFATDTTATFMVALR